jgi:low temperature requirement protein LtrA
VSSEGQSTTPPVPSAIKRQTARIADEGHRSATWLELFFDLCFVVAIAALARAFHSDPTWEGAWIYVALFVPLWWAWMGFTWFANTFDNDDVIYRAVVFAAMLAIIWLATSVEAAAHGETLAFALAYIVLRSLNLALYLRARWHAVHHEEDRARDSLVGFTNRTIAGSTLGLVPWIVSLAFEGEVRYALWAVGLLIELGTPYLALRPLERAAQWHQELSERDKVRESYGMAPAHGGVLRPTDLFHLDHIRERYGLFTIIVLGESVLAVSIGVAEVGWTASSMLTASLVFLAAVSIWWTYFDRSGRDALTSGLATSFVWGYAHFVIFAGIAAIGVGTELLIEQSAAGAETAILAAEEGEAVAHASDGALPGSAIVAGGIAAFWFGMTAVNLANLGFRFGRRVIVFLGYRAALAVLLIVLAVVDVLQPVAFAGVVGIGMLLLNGRETRAVLRQQQAAARA